MWTQKDDLMEKQAGVLLSTPAENQKPCMIFLLTN